MNITAIDQIVALSLSLFFVDFSLFLSFDFSFFLSFLLTFFSFFTVSLCADISFSLCTVSYERQATKLLKSLTVLTIHFEFMHNPFNPLNKTHSSDHFLFVLMFVYDRACARAFVCMCMVFFALPQIVLLNFKLS